MTVFFHRMAALIAKEFQAVWRDPQSRRMLTVPILIQLGIFSFAATLEVKNISIAVLNQDRGRWGAELVQRFVGAGLYFRHITFLDRPEQIQDTIDNQRALLALHIREDFSRRIEAGQSTSIQCILDGRKLNASQMATGYISAILQNFTMDIPHRSGHRPIATPTVSIQARNWFNPNLDYIRFTVPSLIAILSMLTALVVTSLSIAREREMGTFEQLLVSPLSPLEILLGKTVPAILFGMGSAMVIFMAGIVLFRIEFQGNIALLALGTFLFLLAISGIGLFISSLSLTQQQAILGAIVFMAPAVLLSGFASPVDNMPPGFQRGVWANPMWHFLVIIKAVYLKDAPMHALAVHFLSLGGIAMFTLVVAGWFFRRRME